MRLPWGTRGSIVYAHGSLMGLARVLRVSHGGLTCTHGRVLYTVVCPMGLPWASENVRMMYTTPGLSQDRMYCTNTLPLYTLHTAI